jgi:hypothetical protein
VYRYWIASTCSAGWTRSLEVAKILIAEPLPDIPVRVCRSHAYHICRFIQLPGLNNAEPEKTYRQLPAARRDSLEEIRRRVLILPPIISITRRRRLRKRASYPLERDAGHRALAVGTNAPEHLNGVGGGLPWRRDFRDLQLPADIFE